MADQVTVGSGTTFGIGWLDAGEAATRSSLNALEPSESGSAKSLLMLRRRARRDDEERGAGAVFVDDRRVIDVVEPEELRVVELLGYVAGGGEATVVVV